MIAEKGQVGTENGHIVATKTWDHLPPGDADADGRRCLAEAQR